MIALLLFLACSGPATADGFPVNDGLHEDEPAEDLGTLADAIPEPVVVAETPAVVVEDAPEVLTEAEVVESIAPELLSPAEQAMVEIARRAAEEAAVRTAEEITRRGPFGGGFMGLSQAQWFDHLKVAVGLIISILGAGIANALLRVKKAIDAQSAERGGLLEAVGEMLKPKPDPQVAELLHANKALQSRVATLEAALAAKRPSDLDPDARLEQIRERARLARQG